MSGSSIVQERLRKYYEIVRDEERKAKNQRRTDLSSIKKKVQTLTRWYKELKEKECSGLQHSTSS